MSPGEEQKRSNSRSGSGSGSGRGSGSGSPSNCGSSSENGSNGSHVSGGGSSKSHNSKGSNSDSNGSHSSGGGSTSTGNSDSQHSDSTTISNSKAPQPRSEQQQKNVPPGSVRNPRQRLAVNSPVVYTYDMLKARFHLRLPDAAKSLGISETTLKNVCRKLGVARWPRRLCSMQNRNLAETPPEGASAEDDDNDDPQASEKRKRSPQPEAEQLTSSNLHSTSSSLQSMSWSLPPNLIYHPNAHLPHVPSHFQQQSMASHQLLATRRQTATGRQDFIAGVDGAVVGMQMPTLSGREGFGGAAARTAWRVDTGVAAGEGPGLSRDRNHLNMFGAAKLPAHPPLGMTVSSLTAPASRAKSSPESSTRTQSRDSQGRTDSDAPALNAQAHITREQGASQSEVEYHLDLQALQEHTAFPPLSALLAQGGGGDYSSD